METFYTLGISLGLGLLVGLQRERTESRVGGIRTFPLIALLGTLCALLAQQFGPSVLVAGFVTLFGVLAVANFLAARSESAEPGQTTEVAALLMFVIGAYLLEGSRAVAVVVTGAIAVLLHLKEPMHRFVRHIGAGDMAAVMQFAVITLVVLPVLPDRVYGPYRVLNPFDIWRMVVLIVGISLVGYVAYKVFGERVGTLLGGVFGGMVSSTATTVSYARRTKAGAGMVHLAALVVMIASTIAYARVLVEIAAVAPGQLPAMGMPIGAVLLWTIGISGALFFFTRREKADVPEPSNPAELKSALLFGLAYAAVLFAIGAVKQHFGQTALYAVAVISGLTDMDAITLSTARMVDENRIDPTTGWRLILVASFANLVFKWGVVLVLGTRGLARRVALLFGLVIAGGIAVLLFWPGGGV